VVTVDAVRQHIPCGPAVEPIVEVAQRYLDAGYDRIYVNQIGSNQAEFFRFLAHELGPARRHRPRPRRRRLLAAKEVEGSGRAGWASRPWAQAVTAPRAPGQSALPIFERPGRFRFFAIS
jgi:hypothetical protein